MVVIVANRKYSEEFKKNIVKLYKNGNSVKKISENYNIPNIMFTTYFVYYREKVAFFPITFQPRKAGTNSINLKKIVKIGVQAVRDFYILKKEM